MEEKRGWGDKRKSFFFLEAFLSMCTIHIPRTFHNGYTVVKHVTVRDPDGISSTKEFERPVEKLERGRLSAKKKRQYKQREQGRKVQDNTLHSARAALAFCLWSLSGMIQGCAVCCILTLC